jgi:hypothetical protein
LGCNSVRGAYGVAENNHTNTKRLSRRSNIMAKGKSGKEKPDKDGDKGNDKGGTNTIMIVVVVNGQPTEVIANIHAPLHTIIPEALQKSGNVGQPPENWELKDAASALLDLTKKIGEFGFTAATRLFLSLKAGVAGV